MAYKKAAICFVFFLLLLGYHCQVEAQCGFIQADKLDNAWVVNNLEVLCFNNQMKKVGSYSNFLLGAPTYIDALDPFRVVVFYRSSQSIVVLNSEVSEISTPIILKDKGINEAYFVCRSSNGGFWIFDRIKWEILHFDSGFVATGEKIIPEQISATDSPLSMQEYRGFIYLAFKDRGISRYDGFGAFLGVLPIKTDSYFTFFDGSICYQSEGRYFVYNLDSNENKPFEPQPKCLPIKIQDRFLYFDGRRMVVHKIR